MKNVEEEEEKEEGWDRITDGRQCGESSMPGSCFSSWGSSWMCVCIEEWARREGRA
jgi:hypothetical protein